MRGTEARMKRGKAKVGCGDVEMLYGLHWRGKVDLRGSACARDFSSTELLVVPEDSDKTGEGNLGVEGTGLFHISRHDNVHATGRGVGDVLGIEMRGKKVIRMSFLFNFITFWRQKKKNMY